MDGRGRYKKSPEHRRKISETLKRLGIRPKTASCPTDETRKKMSRSHMGMKYGSERNLKISLAHRGSKSYLWKGGISPLAEVIRKCFKSKEWKRKILQRDDYTCVICKKRGGDMEIDHYPKMFAEIFHENNIKSLDEALACEQFWDTKNGRTLCKPCHKTHGKMTSHIKKRL